MTLALHPTETQPTLLRPILRKPNLHQWQEELNYLEHEVKFYRQLLKMGISNCAIRRKPLMFDLLNDFSNIEDHDLPELRQELSLFREKQNSEPSSALAFSQKLARQNASLKALKSSVFLFVHDLQKLTIC